MVHGKGGKSKDRKREQLREGTRKVGWIRLGKREIVMLCKGSRQKRGYTQSVAIVIMDAPSAVVSSKLLCSQSKAAALEAAGVFELAARFPAVGVPAL